MNKKQNQDLTQNHELIDISKSGRALPWKEKKIKNQLLALAYDLVNAKKAVRLRDCASWLEYKKQSDGLKKLVNANFCRVRLCPMCTWRRGLKIFSQTSQIMSGMESEKLWGYIFLTLTVKNISSEKLSSELDKMFDGWKRFVKRKNINNVVKGWYRGLEVTHNLNIDSKDYDTFHPHFHCVFAVDINYFKNQEYIKHEEWRQLWKESMRLDYDPQVNIKRVKGNTSKAVAEISKYAVKDSDYIIPDDWDLTVDTVRVLDSALHNRRLVAYGKKFRDWHKKLNLDDVDSGDLVAVGADEPELDPAGEKIFYSWNIGYQGYISKNN